jgi:hypothetical protein
MGERKLSYDNKMRVFVPAEDYSFVKGFIMSRLTGECEIRYKPEG